MENEQFKEPTRAWRRRQKERKVQESYRRILETESWPRKTPEEYWFLDPDDEEDMMDIWCMDSEHTEPYSRYGWYTNKKTSGDYLIYIVGRGIINPPVPHTDSSGEVWTEDMPYLTDEEIKFDLLLRAKKKADNQATCGCTFCGNPRKQKWSYGSGRKDEHQKFMDAQDQYEEYGLNVERSRLKRRFTKSGC